MIHIINSINELHYQFPSGEQYEDLYFNFDLEIHPQNISSIRHLNFKKCVFKVIHIHHLTEPEKDISFINCTFLNEFDVSINEIRDFKLLWHLNNNKNDNCHINSNFLGSRFNFSSNKLHAFCYINGINHHHGDFNFIDNIFIKEPKEIIPKRQTGHEVCVIKYCILSNPSFNNNTYYMPFTFFNNILKYDQSYSGHYFNNNIFQKAEFINTDFGDNCTFMRCDFLGTALFNKTRNFEKSNVLFSSCKFTSYTHFGEAEMSLLNIEYCTFQKPVSFQRANLNEINLSEVKFEKGAYFDDIEISILKDPDYFKNLAIDRLQNWKHTLRLIKQELQKSDNKIDYNRFKVYEFNAYKQQLKKEINYLKPTIPLNQRILAKNNYYVKLRSDVFILQLSKFVSDYGTDWRRALNFTLLFGFIIYTTFFTAENCTHNWDLSNWQVFPIGFLRFFILTDFYNPLADGKTYISNNGINHLFSWLIFILGKIFIAFGIYEMIQAFRKFKA